MFLRDIDGDVIDVATVRRTDGQIAVRIKTDHPYGVHLDVETCRKLLSLIEDKQKQAALGISDPL